MSFFFIFILKGYFYLVLQFWSAATTLQNFMIDISMFSTFHIPIAKSVLSLIVASMKICPFFPLAVLKCSLCFCFQQVYCNLPNDYLFLLFCLEFRALFK